MTDYNKIIVLVGIMGSGKTRTGEILARLMELPFIDSDQEIERIANSSVSEIFEKLGEPAFRKREKEVMLRLLSGEAAVVASGGGGFIQPDIKSYIKDKAISIWLKTDINNLVERVSRNNKRPLLKDGNVMDKLQKLIDVRYPIYAQADITVVTDGRTPRDTARFIKTEIDRYLQQ